MGNANGREEGTADQRSNGDLTARGDHSYPSSESMTNVTPPVTPRGSALVRKGLLQQAMNDEDSEDESPLKKGVPTLFTWPYGGESVALEGSWDNWVSRKTMQRTGKDFSILLVLPSGVYHYRFIVDGEWRYIPEFPFQPGESGHICNVLDVNAYVPEYLHSVAEFEGASSPESSYGQAFPGEEEFAKEPALAPSQLNVTVVGMENSGDPNPPLVSSSKPQHVLLNHLFIEKGWPSQQMVAMGLTHRFDSKYVTVVLYKPLKK